MELMMALINDSTNKRRDTHVFAKKSSGVVEKILSSSDKKFKMWVSCQLF